MAVSGNSGNSDAGGTARPALISVRQTTAESKWTGATCPKCSQTIQAGQAAVLCPKCYTPQHLDCWNDNGKRCAIDQTPANVLERVARTAGGAAPAAAGAAEGQPAAAPAAAPAGTGAVAQRAAPRTTAASGGAAPPEAVAGAAAPADAVAVTGESAQPAVASAAAPETLAVAAATQTTGATPAPPRARATAGDGAASPPTRPTASAGAGAGGGAGTSRTAMRSAARRSQAQLTVWPHLLMPEFLSAVLLIIGLTVMSWFVNAPLEEHSNPNRTPSPSKAPWYFLNLQELLLHMHPALAGVIIPTVIIILLMAIPYLDISTEDIGVWFSSQRGKRIAWISTLYTTFLSIGLILLDKFVGLRAVIEQAIPFFKTSWISEIVTQTMLPTTIMWLAALGLYVLIAHFRPTVREVMIGYFTAFAVAWVVLAIIGSAFRGPAQELYWPWSMPPRVG